MRGVTSVLLEMARARLWVVPSLAAILAAVAALTVVALDPGSVADEGLFGADAESVRSILSSIAGAMITLTALVFSITMLVLQQAAAQLSPRVMRTFLRDRTSQAGLALFVAAFVFSLVVLLDIKEAEVSRLGVVAAVGLVLAAVLAFVVYIDHMAHAIRPISVIRSIGSETRGAIDRNYPAEGSEEAQRHEAADLTDGALEDAPTADVRDLNAVNGDDEAARFVDWPGESGYIQAFDEDELLAIAEREGRSLRLTRGVGSFLVRGSPFLLVEGAVGVPAVADEDIAEVVRAGSERTLSQDPEFGFRQLVDIALRALSPSLNDPTTAVQVIDELHDLLRYLRERPIPSPRMLVRDSGPAVRVPAPDWDAFVHAAVDEIATAGHAHKGVLRRLAGMLADLEHDCPAHRRPSLRRALDLVENAGE